jgi:predicted SAM-dependent methyltransferase
VRADLSGRFRRLRRRVSDGRAIERYLRAEPVPKLQLGAGPNVLPGWLNTDVLPDLYPGQRAEIVFVDATRPLPFGDESFEYVFSEHQIEHISEPAGRRMLAECFRVLRPGGRIRLATPDLAQAVRLYAEPLGERERRYVDWVIERFLPDAGTGNRRCHVLNQMLNAFGHQFVYDEETLRAALEDAGFVQVERFGVGESGDAALRGLEAHGRAIGNEEANALETMVLEASRPSTSPGTGA